MKTVRLLLCTVALAIALPAAGARQRIGQGILLTKITSLSEAKAATDKMFILYRMLIEKERTGNSLDTGWYFKLNHRDKFYAFEDVGYNYLPIAVFSHNVDASLLYFASALNTDGAEQDELMRGYEQWKTAVISEASILNQEALELEKKKVWADDFSMVKETLEKMIERLSRLELSELPPQFDQLAAEQ